MIEIIIPKKKFYGKGSSSQIIKSISNFSNPLIIIDIYFKNNNSEFLNFLNFKKYNIFFLDTLLEPSTDLIDNYIKKIIQKNLKIDCVVAIGGGSTLDTGKAISIMLSNNGLTENYVGWNKVKNKAIYKIGIPTIFGTGSESTKTCVLLNKKNYLKLGINSSESVFDEIILDYSFINTVPKNQHFYTAMDTFIHSFESLSGNYRNIFADNCSEIAMKLFKSSFAEEKLNNEKSNSLLVSASYFGGLGVASSFLGLVHPMSAALSVVFGTKHCISNCIVMRAMKDIYPKYYDEFWAYVEKFKIDVPKNLCKGLTSEKYNDLHKATIIHEKPLANFFGEDFKKKLTIDYLSKLFDKI